MKEFFIKRKKLVFCLSIILIIFLIVGISRTIDYVCQLQLSKNKNINLIFNTDLGYKDFTRVAIQSAISNKNADSIYNINVLCVDLTEKQCGEFKYFEKYDNVNINTVPLTLEMIKDIGNYEVLNTYVTRTDLFKFLMPDIFKDLDKALYIDSDTIIQKDLSNLYNTDIRKHYLGAVRKYMNPHFDVPLFDNTFIELNMKVELTEYNCGVMLLNLKKLRQDNIKEKLIKAKEIDKQRKLYTQDSYNMVIPYDYIKKLSPIYNACVRWEDIEFYLLDFKKRYKPFLKNMNCMDDLFRNAVIIHYAGHLKPWGFEHVRYFETWWHYANMVDPTWKFGKTFPLIELPEPSVELPKENN